MLENILKIVKKKSIIDEQQSWYKGSKTYFECLKDEIKEVEQELKDNNLVYLEDELGDLLWDYLNLLDGLEKEGKISSLENVLSRAEIKYTQRIDAIKDKEDKEKNSSWDQIKQKQKQKLKKQHDELYNN